MNPLIFQEHQYESDCIAAEMATIVDFKNQTPDSADFVIEWQGNSYSGHIKWPEGKHVRITECSSRMPNAAKEAVEDAFENLEEITL